VQMDPPAHEEWQDAVIRTRQLDLSAPPDCRSFSVAPSLVTDPDRQCMGGLHDERKRDQ